MEKGFNYVRIHNDIRDKILSGEYPSGAQLPTEAELLEHYGVSRITVTKAMEMLRAESLIERFPGRGTFVSDNSRQKERLAAAPLRAHDMATPIGVLIPSIYSSFGWKLLSGIAKEANRRGCCLMTGLNYSTVEEENRIIQRLLDSGAKGIIAVPLHSATDTNTGVISCAMDGVPLVLADRFLEGIPVSYVGSDHMMGAYKATEYLFRLGHKAIGLVSSAPTTTAIYEREQGFMRAYAMTSHQFYTSFLMSEIQSSMPGQGVPEVFDQDVERMKKYYRDNPQVTALLCIDYKIMKVCKKAAQELGMRIPEDLSLTCFDAPDDDIAQFKYTYVQQPELQIGTTAVDILLKTIDGDRKIQNVLLPTELFVGMSTGKPKK